MRRAAQLTAAAAVRTSRTMMEAVESRVMMVATPFGAVDTGVDGFARGIALQVDAQGNLQAIVVSGEQGTGAGGTGTETGGPSTIVSRFTSAGAADVTLAGSGTVTTNPGGGNVVGGVAVDAAGNIYTTGRIGVTGTDTNAYQVRVSPTGTVEVTNLLSAVGNGTTSEAGRTVVIGTVGTLAQRPVVVGDSFFGTRQLQTLWPQENTGGATATPTTQQVPAETWSPTDPTEQSNGATASFTAQSAVTMNYGENGQTPGVVVGGYERGMINGQPVVRLFVSRMLATQAAGDSVFGTDAVNGGGAAGSFRLTLPAGASDATGRVSVAVDPGDNSIYVAEAQPALSRTNVYHLNSSGKLIQTYGVEQLSQTASATVANFIATGIAVQPGTGRAYLVDQDTMRIAALTPTGALSGVFSQQVLGLSGLAEQTTGIVTVLGGTARGAGIAFGDGVVVASGSTTGTTNLALASAAVVSTANNVAVGAPTNLVHNAAGNSISFTRSVQVAGLTEGTDFRVEYYLSGDGALTVGDLPLTVQSSAGDQVTVAVPASVGRANYNVIARVVMTAGAEESTANDDVAASTTQVTVGRQVGATISFPGGTTVQAGSNLTGGTLTLTYAGQGTGDVTAQLALRPVSVPDGSADIPLTDFTAVTESLGRDTTAASRTVSVRVPREVAAGDYVVVADVTAPAADATTTVSDATSGTVAVTPAPASTSTLTVGGATYTTPSIRANMALRGTVTLATNGEATGPLELEYALRPAGATDGSRDIVIAQRQAIAGGVGANTTLPVTFTFTVPAGTATGTYNVVARVSDAASTVAITNPNGSVGADLQVVQIRSTVAVTGITYSLPAPLPAGSVVSGSVTLENEDQRITGPVTVGLFLRPAGATDGSQDIAMPTVDPVRATNFTVGGGEDVTVQFTNASIPRTVTPGNYVIVAKVTAVPSVEVDFDPAAAVAGGTIVVTEAPAITSRVGVTGLSYKAAPTPLGGTVTGSVKVRNTGTAAVTGTAVRLALRPVGAADASQDIAAGSVTFGSIGRGKTATAQFTATVPAGTATGNYQLVASIPLAPNAASEVTGGPVAGKAFRVTLGADLVTIVNGPTGILEGGKRATVRVQVLNRGDTPVNGRVVVVVYAVGGNLLAGPTDTIPNNAIAVSLKRVKVNLAADTSANNANSPRTGVIPVKFRITNDMATLNRVPKGPGLGSNAGRVRFLAAVNAPGLVTAPVPEQTYANNAVVTEQQLTVPAHVPDLAIQITKVSRKGATVRLTNNGARDANVAGSLDFFSVDDNGNNTALLRSQALSTATRKFKLVGGASKSIEVKFDDDVVVLGEQRVRAVVSFPDDPDNNDNVTVSTERVRFT